MTDQELLLAAARAAGLQNPRYVSETSWGTGISHGKGDEVYRVWNPLTDDGDALRLAVKFGMHIGMCDDAVLVTCAGHIYRQLFEWHNDDPYAATRRAIVRAAAEIGKEQK